MNSQLQRQNASLIFTITEIDEAILRLADLCDFDGEARTIFAKLLAGARARDTANHSGDLIAGRTSTTQETSR